MAAHSDLSDSCGTTPGIKSAGAPSPQSGHGDGQGAAQETRPGGVWRERAGQDRHMALPPGLSWQLVHPITPALEGWKIIAGVLAIISIQNIDEFIEVYQALRAANFDIDAVSGRTLWYGGVGLVALLVIGVVVLVAQWRSRSFAVDEAGVYWRTGILVKQLRIARLPRIQSVDIVHPLLGRIFGLGQLVVEVAGGRDSHVRIGYLRTGDLEDLRERILDLAAGAPTAPSGAAASCAPAPCVVPGVGSAPGVLSPAASAGRDGHSALASGAPGGMPGTEVEAPTATASTIEQTHTAQAGLTQLGAQVSDPATAGTASDMPLGFDDLAEPASPAERERMAALQRRLERPEETPLYEVDPRVLIGALLRSVFLWFWVLVLAAMVVLSILVLTGVLGRDRREVVTGVLVPALPVILAVVGGVWSKVKQGWGFRAAATPAGIRVRHGLTSTVSTTLPPGRVHAITLSQGPLWRSKDWWKVEATLAGKSGGESTENGANDSSATLLPVGDRDTALRALWLVIPDLGVADPGPVLAAALTGVDDAGVGDLAAPIGSPERGFVRVSRRARLFTPLGLRRTAVLTTDTCLIERRGRIWRSVLIVPYARIQSFSVSQGPWARRRGLAGYDLDLVEATPGAALNNFEAADVAALRDVLAERCLRAAHTEHLDRWLARAAQDVAERNGAGGRASVADGEAAAS